MITGPGPSVPPPMVWSLGLGLNVGLSGTVPSWILGTYGSSTESTPIPHHPTPQGGAGGSPDHHGGGTERRPIIYTHIHHFASIDTY